MVAGLVAYIVGVGLVVALFGSPLAKWMVILLGFGFVAFGLYMDTLFLIEERREVRAHERQ